MPYAVRTIARSRASARLRPLRSPSGLPPRPQPRLVSAWTYPILPSPKGCPIISCGGGHGASPLVAVVGIGSSLGLQLPFLASCFALRHLLNTLIRSLRPERGGHSPI